MTSRKRKIIVLCTALLVALLLGIQCVHWEGEEKKTMIEEEASIAEYVLNFENKEYTGIYTGRTKNDQPEGRGIFSCSDFVLNGKWKSGRLSGKSQIEYKDGSTQEATFKNGQLTKELITYDSKGYTVEQYKNGKAYGLSVTYNEDEEVIALDRYYDGLKVSEWMKQAEKISYKELYNDQYSYIELPILVKGTVYYVKQEENECCLKIRDEDGHTYIASYENVHVSKYKQAVIPNLRKGDKVEVCGFFNGIETYSESEEKEYGFSYPHLMLIYGVLQEQKEKLVCDYENISKNPYMFAGLECQLELITSKVKINYENKKIFIEAVDEEKNIYYIHYKLKENDRIPVEKEKISIIGRYNGNEKRKKKDEANLYPCVSANKIEVE